MGIKKAKLVGQFAEQAQGVAKQAGIFRGMVQDTNTKYANSEIYTYKLYPGGGNVFCSTSSADGLICAHPMVVRVL